MYLSLTTAPVTKQGESPLAVAVRKGNLDMIKCLVKECNANVNDESSVVSSRHRWYSGLSVCVHIHVHTVNSRYSGPLNCGHLDTYLGTDLKLHQDCTNLVSDLRSPRYSVLQPLLETPISAIVFILQPEVMFVGVVMIKT